MFSVAIDNTGSHYQTVTSPGLVTSWQAQAQIMKERNLKIMQPNSRFQFKPYSFSPLHEGYLTTGYYSCNYRTALQLYYYDSECSAYYPYATLTVNLPDDPITDNNCVYIDTNNCPFALSLLIDVLHCAEFTGHVAQSGRCYYSEVRLIPDELNKYIPYKEEI